MTNRKVLIDSSVWIESYRPSVSPKLREKVRNAVLNYLVMTTGVIVIEVIQGAREPDHLSGLWYAFSKLVWLDTDRQVVEQAAHLSFQLRRNGTHIPSIDLLIAASALVHDCELWHQDKHFIEVARAAPLQQVSFIS